MPDAPIPDRFEVLEEVSHGDGEILLRARDNVLQREVVLRRPATALSTAWRDKNVADAELRSARALARVQHKGVVRLIDVIPMPDGALVVMEPVPGETLAERLGRDTRIAPDELLRIGRDLVGALEAVHAHGVVHRGVSASNIVIRPDGTPCLAGFVFAKFDARADAGIPGTTFVYTRGQSQSMRSTAAALPPHPSPEQVQGKPADARSDLFAFGWVMYEALTGEPPYPRDLDCERWDEPVDPRKLVPETPKAFAQVILRCLKRSPLQRFPSAADLATALDAVATAAAAAAVTGGSAGASSGPRGPRIALAAAAGVLVTGLGAWLALRGGETAAGEGQRGVAVPAGESKPAGSEYGDSYSRSTALLIGISDYEGTGWNNLSNAERDVRELEKRLRAMQEWEGWDVRTLIGPQATKQGIKDALVKLAEDTQDPESRAFLYYAGHGSSAEFTQERGYVIPVDAKPKEQDRSRNSWLLFHDSFDLFFMQTKAKHVLLALDCCYGGGVSNVRGPSEMPRDKLLRRKAHIVFASSAKDEQASDGLQGEHSPFAQAFLDTLADPKNDIVTSADLGAAITRALRPFPRQNAKMGYLGFDGGDGQFVFFTQRPR